MCLYLNPPKCHLIFTLASRVRSKDLLSVDQCNLRQGLYEKKWEGCGMCREDCRETSTFVCVGERDKEGLARGLAHTVFGNRRGKGCAMVLDQVR